MSAMSDEWLFFLVKKIDYVNTQKKRAIDRQSIGLDTINKS